MKLREKLLELVLLITGESNQACYLIKYKIKLINIHNIVPMIIYISDLKQFNDEASIISVIPRVGNSADKKIGSSIVANVLDI